VWGGARVAHSAAAAPRAAGAPMYQI
jgi:hypothetical protein